MGIAVALGLLLAVLRVFTPRWISWPVVGLIEIIRGTPLLIQLFIIFYGLPAVGIRFSPFWAAVVGLGINYAAYEAENYRAGIQSIPRGQLDAALALGLNRLQTIRKIILPQAMRLVIPPVTNDFIALLKDSSLVSVITMVELTKMYGQLAATYYDYIGLGILTALIYFLLGLPIARLSRMLEGKLAYMKT
jgi:polar amino acid transport system substrate-binding protein